MPLPKDPIILFSRWYRHAMRKEKKLPDAMCLSTVGKSGRPSARVVLLKDFDRRGFVFYTNFRSQKGKEISRNPFVSLTFYWKAADRQVRIEGKAVPVSGEEADRYFHSRPRGYQIGAWASDQSARLTDRSLLVLRYRKFENKFRGIEVPRPSWWSGYRVVPSRIEFWENRPNRLHERIVFDKSNRGWKSARLFP